MSPSAAGQPVYFEVASESVFGFFHPASDSSLMRPAVLICAPFAWDDVASYRPRREWAAQLAACGHPTLRFDWPGTGDSGGSPRDPGRLEAWTEAVNAAAAWLASASGGRRVAAIGLGLGGLVAWRAAGRGTPLDEIVLWAVPARGRKFVRELEMFGRLQAAGAPTGGPEAAVPAAGVLAGGFLFTADTREAIEGLDVDAMPLPPAPARRALLLDRDGIALEPSLREALERGGADITEEQGPGYGAMTAGPQEARPPVEVFDRVSTWLSETSPSHNGHSPAGGLADQAIELDVDGTSIRETPFSVDQPFGRLFGVLAVPTGSSADMCAVLLNAGAIRRIGPNRMWVEMARRAAAQGVPTLRLDLEGLGDADGDAARYAHVAELYVPELIDQARAALDAMVARGFSPRFILGGLCSGAYWSFHAALRDDRVLATFLLNPQVLFWDSSVSIGRDARRVRELLRASSWLKLVRGEVPVRRGLEIVCAAGSWARLALRRLAERLLARGHSERSQNQRLEEAVARLRDDGKHVVLVFGGEEPLHDELEREGRLGALESYPNLELELVPGAPHTLSPVWAQHRVHELFDRLLTRELAARRK